MEKNTEFICFTSAAGGAGCSGCSVGFARILSLMLKKNILYLSLDLLSEKMSYVSERTESTKRLLTSMMDYEEDFDKLFKSSLCEDEFHVRYLSDTSYFNPLHALTSEDMGIFLNRISKSRLSDMVILDVPFRNLFAEKIACCCEKIIVVSGYLSSQVRLNSSLYSHFEGSIRKLESKPELILFSPSEDSDSFDGADVDIHGQLGAELRALAMDLYQGRT